MDIANWRHPLQTDPRINGLGNLLNAKSSWSCSFMKREKICEAISGGNLRAKRSSLIFALRFGSLRLCWRLFTSGLDSISSVHAKNGALADAKTEVACSTDCKSSTDVIEIFGAYNYLCDALS